MLLAEAGFVRTPTARSLVVNALPDAADPLTNNLQVGAALGLLGIELHTRRRNRANGKLTKLDALGFEVAVTQSFGNCKKYIQSRRPLELAALERPPSEAQNESATLSAAARAMIEQADTVFIATASASTQSSAFSEGVDVSHRGGDAGFLRQRVEANTSILRMPDYSGNFMFNTFGNLEVNPRAGLLVPNFATGEMLSLTCSARVIWEGPEIAEFEAAERLLDLSVETGVLYRSTRFFDWSSAERSPFLPNSVRAYSVAQR
jgi:predicted pyridoxine 5'-phosphate oxidase superfamily flavin-nucleotide-binding protein